MPRCQGCGNSVSSSALSLIGEAAICPDCGKLKLVEEKMSDKKQVLSITLNEISTPDSTTDHEVRIEGEYAGLEVKFKTTFDEVRAFFTQKREKDQRAKLQSVK